MVDANEIINATLRKRKHEYYLYLAYSPETDLVKVGLSRNLAARRRALGPGVNFYKTWSFGEMKLREIWRIEQAVHAELEAYCDRVHGEWFNADCEWALALVEHAIKVVTGE